MAMTANELENMLAVTLMNSCIEAVTEDGGRVRVEDVLTVAAAVTAERCIDAAGEFSARTHTFPPGARVFSDQVNALLCGDVNDIASVPPESVFGIIRDRVRGAYALAEFPSLDHVFATFASASGDAALWGRAPLSVASEHAPLILPLRAAYEMRGRVDRILLPLANDAMQCLRVCALAVGELLLAVAEAIEPRTAIAITFETINGMAKTAPMTDAALAAAANDEPDATSTR